MKFSVLLYNGFLSNLCVQCVLIYNILMTYNIQILFIYIGTHHNPPTQIYMTIYYIKVEFFYTFLFDQATHPNRIDLSTIQNYILIFRKTCAVGIIYIGKNRYFIRTKKKDIKEDTASLWALQEN